MDYKKKYEELKKQAQKACKTKEEKERFDNEVAFFAEKGIEEYVALAVELVNNMDHYGHMLFVGGTVYDSLFVALCRENVCGDSGDVKEVRPSCSFEEFSKTPLNLKINAVGPDNRSIADHLQGAVRGVEPVLRNSNLYCKELLLTSLKHGAHQGERIVVSTTPVSEEQLEVLSKLEAGTSPEAWKYFLIDVQCFYGI